MSHKQLPHVPLRPRSPRSHHPQHPHRSHCPPDEHRASVRPTLEKVGDLLADAKFEPCGLVYGHDRFSDWRRIS